MKIREVEKTFISRDFVNFFSVMYLLVICMVDENCWSKGVCEPQKEKEKEMPIGLIRVVSHNLA